MRQVQIRTWVADYGIAAGQTFAQGKTTLNIPAVVVQGECDIHVSVIFDSSDAAVAGGLQPMHGVYQENLGQTVSPGQLQYHAIVALFNPDAATLIASKAIRIRLVITQLAETTGFFSPDAN